MSPGRADYVGCDALGRVPRQPSTVHRPQQDVLPGESQEPNGGVGQAAMRWPEQVDGNPGLLLDRPDAQLDLAPRLRQGRLGEVHVAPTVRTDLVVRGRDLAHEIGVLNGVVAHHHERRLHAVTVEEVEDPRREFGIGPIVERQSRERDIGVDRRDDPLYPESGTGKVLFVGHGVGVARPSKTASGHASDGSDAEQSKKMSTVHPQLLPIRRVAPRPDKGPGVARTRCSQERGIMERAAG